MLLLNLTSNFWLLSLEFFADLLIEFFELRLVPFTLKEQCAQAAKLDKTIWANLKELGVE